MHRLLWQFLLSLLLLNGVMQTQTQVTCPDAPPSRLVVGQDAIVLPPAGINLRDRPGLNTNRMGILPGEARLNVLEGPVCGAGFAWWRIDYDGTRGWAAEGTPDAYWLEPYLRQRIRTDGFELDLPQVLAQAVLVQDIPEIALDPATDVMRINQPALQRLLLQGYPLVTDATSSARIDLSSITAYQRLSPRANTALNQLQGLLSTQPTLADADMTPFPTAPSAQLPEVFNAQGQYLDFQNGQGLRAVVAYTLVRNLQDERPQPATTQNTRLAYVYQGLSADGSTFVLAQFPVTTDLLPEQAFISDGAERYAERVQAHNRDVAAILDAATTDAFTPDLATLDELMQSLLTTPPPEPDDAPRLYEYFDSVRFEYPPGLAQDVRATTVQAADDEIATHVRFDLTGYVLNTYQYAPALRVYRTDALAGDSIRQAQLARLQTLIAQGGDATGSIPILHMTASAQYFRTQAQVLRFQNGSGVRFLTAYPDAIGPITNLNLFYSYQGLSADGAFYVSLILPVHTPALAGLPAPETYENYNRYIAEVIRALEDTTQFNPPLAELDGLAASLRLGAP